VEPAPVEPPVPAPVKPAVPQGTLDIEQCVGAAWAQYTRFCEEEDLREMLVAKCGAWRHAPWPNAGPPPTAPGRVSESKP
jgi:hypothetical protein